MPSRSPTSRPKKDRTPPLPEWEQRALAHLLTVDPVLYRLALAHPGITTARVTPRTRRDQLFETLASSVVGQQLSVKAASAIWKRVKAACGGRVSAKRLLLSSDGELRACGLSASKVKTLKSLSTAITAGTLDLAALRDMTHDEAIAALTAVWGIGPWTSEMFLILALGAEDVFSPGDLGLVRSIERHYGLPKDAPRDQILAIAAQWTPHRSFASLVLWEHYDGGAALT